MFSENTENVVVSVMPVYIDERSDPAKNEHFWAYRVLIENQGRKSLTLISRYWHITDANGVIEEIEDEGVVGETPKITAGESYEYTSGCPLNATSGIMTGHYIMVYEDGAKLKVAIPTFSLDLPDITPTYN